LKAALKSSFFMLIVSWISIGFCFKDARAQQFAFDFYGNTFNFVADSTTAISFHEPLANASVKNFYNQLSSDHHQSIIEALQAFKTKHQLNDWLYYQLIRKTKGGRPFVKFNMFDKQQDDAYNRSILYRRQTFLSPTGRCLSVR
jgi:hypothetical protein